MYCVYTYSVPGEEKPFYVGKGPRRRAFEHLQEQRLFNRKTHFYNKLNSLLGRGIAPEIKFVATGLTEQQAFDLEINLIKVYGRRDLGTGCLCNHTNGGEGNSGVRSGQALANIRKGRGKAVESYSRVTGRTLKKYEVAADVKFDGYNIQAVSHVLRGRHKHAYGLGWRYST